MLMGSDSGGEWAPATVVGNNISISINADSRADADRVFNGLVQRRKNNHADGKMSSGEIISECAPINSVSTG